MPLTGKTITPAERAARTAHPGKPIAVLRKKNPDGTYCKTCKPIPIYSRQPQPNPLPPTPCQRSLNATTRP
jgi:hypothetical protein